MCVACWMMNSSDSAAACSLAFERVTGSHFHVRQYNPAKVWRLSRNVWEPAHKVTGKYNRDPSRKG